MNALKVEYWPVSLRFKRPAKTSRGAYTTRQIWFVKVGDDHSWGIGECAPLPDLSVEDGPDYERILRAACEELAENGWIDVEKLRPYPSILFGLETAMRHRQSDSPALWPTLFADGTRGIQINGLVWMGDYRFMQEQIEEKIRAGFRCVKLKIGAIHFEEELELLRKIRARFSAQEIELRVDANGAFSPDEALDKLHQLAELDLHSIEQPIRAGQWEDMARLVERSPLPIALDEELIGCCQRQERERLLKTIRPHYLVLKPSLHGGFSGCTEWIRLTESILGGTPKEPKWWLTSALESNVGLNAIAQFCAHITLDSPSLPQGLGTGQLFVRNVPPELHLKGDTLWFHPPVYR